MASKGKSCRRLPTRMNDCHQRLNYLYQAAQKMFSQSSDQTDGMNSLGRFYLNIMKGIRMSENIKIDKTFGRTFCKNCRRLFVISKNAPFPLRLRVNKKKILTRTCCFCGNKVRLAMNRSYLSRNEKAGEKTECNTDVQQQTKID